MHKKTSLNLSIIAVLVAAASCANIVGIEDARVDPNVSGAAGTGGSSPGTGGSGPLADASTPCDDYCSKIATLCVDHHSDSPPYNNQQFSTLGVCQAVCSKMSPGNATDTLTNTLACRTHYLDLIEKGAGDSSDSASFCTAAGPAGGDNDKGTCGTVCANFCQLLQSTCTTLFSSHFADITACNANCGATTNDDGLPYVGEYNFSQGSGNSINCRLYHLTVANTEGLASAHCPHAFGEPNPPDHNPCVDTP